MDDSNLVSNAAIMGETYALEPEMRIEYADVRLTLTKRNNRGGRCLSIKYPDDEAAGTLLVYLSARDQEHFISHMSQP